MGLLKALNCLSLRVSQAPSKQTQASEVGPERKGSNPSSSEEPCASNSGWTIATSGLGTLPPELLYMILDYLNYSDHFALKMTGNRRVTAIIQARTKPSFNELLANITDENSSMNLPEPNLAAVAKGHISVVNRIIEESLWLNGWVYSITRKQWKHYALQYATIHNQIPMVHNLLDLKQPDPALVVLKSGRKEIDPIRSQMSYPIHGSACHLMSPLHLAVKYGRQEILVILLDRLQLTGEIRKQSNLLTSVRHRSGVARTYHSLNWLAGALHVGAQENRVDMMEILVAYGVDPNYRYVCHRSEPESDTEDDWLWKRRWRRRIACWNHRACFPTALHFAANAGSVEAASYLISIGAKLNARDMYGVTPLHLAADEGHEAVVSLLCKAGADMEVYSKESGYLDATEANKCNTPLSHALKYGRIGAARVLLNSGAVIQWKGNYSTEPVFQAVTREFEKQTVKFIRDSEEVEVLSPAVRQEKSLSLLNLLLSHAPPDRIDEVLEKLMCATSSCQQNHLLQHLLNSPMWSLSTKAKAVTSAVQAAASGGYSWPCKKLLGFHLSHPSAQTTSIWRQLPQQALLWASAAGQLSLIEELLEKGSDITLDGYASHTIQSVQGLFTSLHAAADTGEYAVIRYLLQHGAQMELKSPDGKTALHYAAAKGDGISLREILKWKPQIDSPDNRGRTPLFDAAGAHQDLSVELLLQHDADPKWVDKDGYVPINLVENVPKGGELTLRRQLVYDMLSRATGNKSIPDSCLL